MSYLLPSHRDLPHFATKLLSNPPEAGEGVHNWIFRAARCLHGLKPSEDIVVLLANAVQGCGRQVPMREILEAVENSKAFRWHPKKKGSSEKKEASKVRRDESWDTFALDFKNSVIRDNPVGLEDLLDMSPTCIENEIPDAEWFIDSLFPGNPLLCVAAEKYRSVTAPREDFRGRLRYNPLIVPSPMTALHGHRKADAKESPRTLDNTGCRHYLVTEFDQGTQSEQTAIIWHLTRYAPLVLVLWSGGKSLHAWWNCQGENETTIHRFMKYAVGLGADRATWSRAQLVRLPGGWRSEKGVRQRVWYFDHNKLNAGKEEQ